MSVVFTCPIRPVEILTEAVLRNRCLDQADRRRYPLNLPEAVLEERLLLVAYGYGTNSGLRTVAVGDHPHSAEDLRYTAGSVRR